MDWVVGRRNHIRIRAGPIHPIRERRQRLCASKDKNAQIIQEIHVIAQRVIQIGLINDNQPIVAFLLGDNKILLSPRSMASQCRYGTGVASVEAIFTMNSSMVCESLIHSPAQSSRLPDSQTAGEVVGIHVAGEYLLRLSPKSRC